MESQSGSPNIPRPHRPMTLGEILLREENLEEMPPPPPRLARSMSETRRLGPLANGRPRRPRVRTLARPSTSAAQTDDNEDTNEDTQPRRRRASVTVPGLGRWRSSTVDRGQSLYSFVTGSGSRHGGRHHGGNSRAFRPRHHSVAGRADSPDLFYNPFGWHRHHSVGRHAHPRPRSGPFLHSRPHRAHRSIITVPLQGSSARASRMVDVYDSRSSFSQPRSRASTSSASARYLRAGRPRSTVVQPPTEPEATQNAENGNAEHVDPEMPNSVRRFVDFAAEFIPVTLPPPDAEPPEWSMNTTPADFGPFAIGRSAVSRARSLAMMAALSQVPEESNSGANQ